MGAWLCYCGTIALAGLGLLDSSLSYLFTLLSLSPDCVAPL